MKKVALTENELAIITNILKPYPQTVLFGSRVKGTHKRFSDLDVGIKDVIRDADFVLLEEAFEESDLPFKVDLIDYKRVSDLFKEIIDRDAVLLSDLAKQN